MKNFLLLILTASLFSGCDFSTQKDQLQKHALKQDIRKLELRKKQLIKQRSELREQLQKTILTAESVSNRQKQTNADRQAAHEKLNSAMHNIQFREVALEKQLLETDIKIRKLELEYAKLVRRSKFGIP